MKRNPLSNYANLLTNAMVLFPFLFPLITAVLFELTWKGIGNIFLMPTFFLACIAWVFTGYGIRRFRKWAWYSLNFAALLTFYVDTVTLVNFTESPRKFIAYALALLVLFHIYLTARRELLVPYLFPKIRWWEFGIAGMNHIPVKVWSRPASDAPGQILDLSTKGCFIKSPGQFHLHEAVEIVGEAYQQPFRLMGKVLWVARSTVTHPRGIGVQFIEMDKATKKKVKALTDEFLKEQKNAPIIRLDV